MFFNFNYLNFCFSLMKKPVVPHPPKFSVQFFLPFGLKAYYFLACTPETPDHTRVFLKICWKIQRYWIFGGSDSNVIYPFFLTHFSWKSPYRCRKWIPFYQSLLPSFISKILRNFYHTDCITGARIISHELISRILYLVKNHPI